VRVAISRHPSLVIGSLIRSAAREAVKHNIRAQGLKVQHFLPREITFITKHRETPAAGALRAVERSPELQRILDKHQRDWTKAESRI